MQNITDKIKHFFERNSRILFITAFGLTIMFSLFLFNFKVIEGSDDSSYIFGAWKFIQGDVFPQWHGTFYQIFLGVIIFFFGKDLLILKLTSFVLILFFFVWIYRTFKNKMPAYVLFISIFLISINSHIVIYSSLTYSEALYLALQIVSVYLFFVITTKIDSELNYFKLWKEWLSLSVVMLLLYLTRNVGIAMLISVILYFIFSRKPKAVVFTLIPFIFFYFIFFLYKFLFWKNTSMVIENQSAVFFLKDPYNPAIGNEDLSGFLIRFLKNIYQYLYEQFFAISGINVGDPNLYNLIFSIVFVILLIIAFTIFMKSNKLFSLIGIYLITSFGITFITVHSFLSQQRLVMIYYPFIILIIFYALDKTLSKSKAFLIKTLPFAIGCLSLFLVLKDSIKQIKESIPVIVKNISGNTFYGYSSGCDNYLKLSEWCGNNLSVQDIVGCRNPTMSFIYGKNKEFKGIYNFPSLQIDSFLASVKKSPKVIIIDLRELQSDKLLQEDKLFIRRNLWGLMMSEKRRLGIIQTDTIINDNLMKIIEKCGLSYSSDIGNLSNMASYNNVVTVILKNLIETLQKQNINYLLDGRIASGYTINQQEMNVNIVKHYIFFISQKYPDLFEKVRAEGENYLATLYRIHWEKI